MGQGFQSWEQGASTDGDAGPPVTSGQEGETTMKTMQSFFDLATQNGVTSFSTVAVRGEDGWTTVTHSTNDGSATFKVKDNGVKMIGSTYSWIPAPAAEDGACCNQEQTKAA